MAEAFPDDKYEDVAGLCKVATLAEIESQGWSLNPGRYVGVEATEEDGFVFSDRLADLAEEFDRLSRHSASLQNEVSTWVAKLLEVQ
jgi:type I restriction enzyme M protein